MPVGRDTLLFPLNEVKYMVPFNLVAGAVYCRGGGVWGWGLGVLGGVGGVFFLGFPALVEPFSASSPSDGGNNGRASIRK